MQLLVNIFQFHSQAAKGSTNKTKSEARTYLVLNMNANPEWLHRLNMGLQVESELCLLPVQV